MGGRKALVPFGDTALVEVVDYSKGQVDLAAQHGLIEGRLRDVALGALVDQARQRLELLNGRWKDRRVPVVGYGIVAAIALADSLGIELVELPSHLIAGFARRIGRHQRMHGPVHASFGHNEGAHAILLSKGAL